MEEDNNGFVNFPVDARFFNKKDGKTFIYLVAFDALAFQNLRYDLSNVSLNLRGDFISDDISMKNQIDFEESLVNTDRFFPNLNITNNENGISSIPLTSCICIGWDNNTYDLKDEDLNWCATFRDLSNEGRRLYYSIKKLHNTKEVRILTFNNI